MAQTKYSKLYYIIRQAIVKKHPNASPAQLRSWTRFCYTRALKRYKGERK